MRVCILLLSSVILCNLAEVLSHGRLEEPPARGSAWRHGFNTPKDYNDIELYCGGFQNQWEKQGGKCGICGDPYQGPRKNECPSGEFCSKVIVKTYKVGQVIDVKVNLTANHFGYFVFRVCPVTDESREVTQECLNKNELIIDGTNSAQYNVPNKNAGLFATRVKLPNGLSCERCVFQWDYHTGNTWGKCADGSMKTGCGPQETFRGCADIKIGSGNSVKDDNHEKATTQSIKQSRTTKAPNNTPSEPINNNKNGCKSVNNDSRYDTWCQQNCAANNCPPSICKCN